jgi:hypothetical protein
MFSRPFLAIESGLLPLPLALMLKTTITTDVRYLRMHLYC